jgi:hypothetical protein
MTRPKRLTRNPAVSDTAIDGDIFLVVPDTQDVIYLNKLASALWRYLAEPRERDEIVAVFAAAFPAVRRARLLRDLANAIRDLRRRGLIVAIA